MLWLACIAVVAAGAFYTLRPLFGERDGEAEKSLPAETERDRLMDQKNIVYRNLRDLDLEYRMGRLSKEDFERLASGYKSEAVSVLQRLETLDGPDTDDAIDREVAERKARLFGAQANPHCPSCGAEAIPGKKYCADCGHHL